MSLQLLQSSTEKEFIFHWTKKFMNSLYSVKNEKTRRFNLVSFSELENSEIRLGNETRLSETKLSGDSIN